MERQRLREERSQRAVAAVASVASEHGLSVEEPAVLADLFTLMVHLQPAPVVARVSICMPKLRAPIAEWHDRELAVTPGGNVQPLHGDTHPGSLIATRDAAADRQHHFQHRCHGTDLRTGVGPVKVPYVTGDD